MQVDDDAALAALCAPSSQLKQHVASIPQSTAAQAQTAPASERCEAASCLSAVYWVHKDVAPSASKSWFRETPWATELAPRPATNALNPIPAKPLKLAYAHPADPDWIGVPRFWGLTAFGAPREDRRSMGEALSAAASTLAMPLRPIQTQALDAVLQSARACGGAFVQADCGALNC